MKSLCLSICLPDGAEPVRVVGLIALCGCWTNKQLIVFIVYWQFWSLKTTRTRSQTRTRTLFKVALFGVPVIDSNQVLIALEQLNVRLLLKRLLVRLLELVARTHLLQLAYWNSLLELAYWTAYRNSLAARNREILELIGAHWSRESGRELYWNIARTSATMQLFEVLRTVRVCLMKCLMECLTKCSVSYECQCVR